MKNDILSHERVLLLKIFLNDNLREYAHLFLFAQTQLSVIPLMIELFSRKPNILNLPKDVVISRIPVEEEIVSLSAVLLEEAYFRALQSARRIIKGVSILDETLLIPFKVRAFLDLNDRLANESSVDGRQIKKHRNDVFRLLQLLPYNASIKIAKSIQMDLLRFIEIIEEDRTLNPHTFNVQMTAQQGIARLRSAYEISS